jgi:2-polyprenyl-6-hydroxyphenyl methylase/3-demethylubiquinone-9 3-methyltransferase
MNAAATGYYSEKLAAEKLRKVYDIASPRVRQYLDAEIEFVLEQIAPGDRVLELGCGYGRVLARLASGTNRLFGIDTSLASLRLARRNSGVGKFRLALMNAVQTAFRPACFDLTVCIQNGISAFRVDQRSLIKEAVRITRPGGSVLFSSYAADFWDHRLEWFRAQADCGLLGEIDEEATGDGVIVCKDGFRATTIGAERFRSLTDDAGVAGTVITVDESSVFCIIAVPGKSEAI